MSAADDMKPYLYMQIVGAHHIEGEGVMLELAPLGSMARRFVTLVFDFVNGRVDVEEATLDTPRPTYRNRRGITNYNLAEDDEWANHCDDIGDHMHEIERESRP